MALCGDLLDYDYDYESATFSRPAFLKLLGLLEAKAGITRIFVIAHSMGNQLVVDSLSHASAQELPVPVSETVLAAPDVSVDVFKSMADRLKVSARGITLYASAADKALKLSELKAKGPRAGSIATSGDPYVELAGIETIDVTAVGDDMFALDHGTYSAARAVIDDIGHLLIDGIHPPNLRTPEIRGMPEGSIHPLYWIFPR